MKFTTLLSFCALLALTTACGIKPAEVDPPQGHKQDRFPHTYPSPAAEKQ